MIRTVRQWEAPQVELLAREFHDLADCGTTFSSRRFWETIRSMELREALFLHGMFVGDVLVGMLIGTVAPQMMTETTVAQEIMWYVKPEHRKGTGSVRLLLEFEAWAKKHGADGIIMASFAATGERKLGEFYSRRGYKPLETHVLKRL